DPADPIPDFPEGLDTDPENDIKNPDELEPGDRVFMTTIQDPVEFIRVSATTSQRLSEAFAKNSAPPKPFHESVPREFHNFKDVFSKISFDNLPNRKPWDHAIELELGAKYLRQRSIHYPQTSKQS